ncbi:hypothetical protein ACRDNQ_01185 [Palleronia sp. KMU-117]|uniref:hypothetical protein n=1 Tax=Palleronia sp. KMU-117 TaxID=3434108 RepID=UPI003D72EE68
MQADKLDARAGELSEKIATGLGIHGKSLEDSARKAGRALPARVRDRIAVIAEARAVRGHPKLERQIDEAGIERAYRDAAHYLDSLDYKASRRRAMLDTLSLIAFRLLVVLVLMIAVLAWRDLI